jgi:hypothetical protein
MSTKREHEILKTLARGGLHPRRVEALEVELHQLRESAERERAYSESTMAGYQPTFRRMDSF